jgi:hypothetical protein
LPKQEVYEQAVELFDDARLQSDDAALSRALALFYEAARARNEYALFTLAELHEVLSHPHALPPSPFHEMRVVAFA